MVFEWQSDDVLLGAGIFWLLLFYFPRCAWPLVLPMSERVPMRLLAVDLLFQLPFFFEPSLTFLFLLLRLFYNPRSRLQILFVFETIVCLYPMTLMFPLLLSIQQLCQNLLFLQLHLFLCRSLLIIFALCNPCSGWTTMVV